MSAGAKEQVGRLLALVPLIRREGDMSVQNAADRLGIDPQQLIDDLRVLIYCGWPGWLPGDLIEVDLDAVWTARGAQMQTRAGWTPFEGWQMKGRVERVVLRGREAYAHGRVAVEPGYGREIGLGRA